MAGGRVVLAAVLASVLAACSGAAPAAPPREGQAAPPVASPTGSLAPASGVAASPANVGPSASSSPSPTPRSAPTATPKPTPVPVPPKLTGVKFRERIRELDDAGDRVRITQTVTWRAPRGAGVRIRVYGVTKCIAEPAHPKPDKRGPCLAKHTRLPASVLHLLAKAPASAGKVTWSWTTWTGCDIGSFSSDPRGPTYFAIVVAAHSSSGRSIFTIAEPGEWWAPPPGSMVC